MRSPTRPSRRAILEWAAGGAASLLAAKARASGPRPASTMAPVLFVSHGSPMTALASDDYTRALARFGTGVRPKAVVIASEYLRDPLPIKIGGAKRPPLIYDFQGFPEAATVHYACPGSHEIALEVKRVLWQLHIPGHIDTTMGLDHGAWIPLRHIFPRGNVPVVEVSLPPDQHPGELIRLGAAFQPLRELGVLLVGSGGVVSNPPLWRPEGSPVDPWARRFDDWVAARVAARDDVALMAYRGEAPAAGQAMPNGGPLDPLFFALGAADRGEKVAEIYAGFRQGNLSLRTFRLG